MCINSFVVRLKGLFVFILMGTANFATYASFQKTEGDSIKISAKVGALIKQAKYVEAVNLADLGIAEQLGKSILDSLEIAKIYIEKVRALQHQQESARVKKNCDKGITYCPKTQDGLNLKGILYYKKAYPKGDMLLFELSNVRSMDKAVNILSQLEKPNWNFSLGGYRYLAESMAHRGNYDSAERYHRLFANLYAKFLQDTVASSEEIKQIVTNYRMLVPYNKVNINYSKRGSSQKDSIKMMQALDALNKQHNSSTFDVVNEGIYYTHGLYCVADWYLIRKKGKEIGAKDIEQALKHINRAIQLVKTQHYPGNLFQYNYAKCKALTFANKLSEAEVLIEELLFFFRKSENFPFFLAQKGLIKAKMQQKDSALSIFHNAIMGIPGNDGLTENYSNFKPTDNFGHTKLILRIAEELNTHYGDDPEVEKRIAKLYDISLSQFEKSYSQRQFNKTYQTLLAQISKGVLTAGEEERTINDTDFLNRLETIRNKLAWKRFGQNRLSDNLTELDSLQERKLQLKGLLVDAKAKQNIGQQDSLDALLDKTVRFTNEAFPSLNLFTEKPFDLDGLQHALAQEETILKYVLLDGFCAIYTIGKENVLLDLVPWGDQEKELVNTYVTKLKKQGFNVQIAEKLSKLLLPRTLGKETHLIINPDGELYRIPFETLEQNGRLLIDEHDVSYTSNLGFVHPIANAKNEGQDLAIYVPDYGDNTAVMPTRSGNWVNLEGAKEEAKSISALFSSTVFKGRDLTKNDFLKTAPKADLIHLAMHAQVDNITPGLSHLVFGTNSEEHEKNLYLDELYEMRLKADLAVLSSCNTGIGKENAGRGMESFQRAFTFAGVPATVASLWEVPDITTKEIIVGFYENLSKGLSKSEALRRAKNNFRDKYAKTEFAEPYYWAGFVVYGEYAPVTEPSNQLPYLIGIALLAILIMLVFFRNWTNSKPNQNKS